MDTRNKKFCAAKVRVTPAHDIKDAKYLVKHSKPKILVADKAYGAEWLHKYCYDNNIEAHIPIRNYGKVRFPKKLVSCRKKAAKMFRPRTYGRRSIGETGMWIVKGKYGGSVNSKKACTIKSEVYGGLLCHNLFGRFCVT